METFGALINACVELMKIPFTIWGFTLSMWQITISVLLGGVIIGLIGGFFFGGK